MTSSTVGASRFQLLSPDEIRESLRGLSGWEYKETWLRKTFVFASFRQAIAFIDRVAEVAEQVDHHPDIYLRYRTVVLILQTHQANHQVTKDDVELARAIERLGSG